MREDLVRVQHADDNVQPNPIPEIGIVEGHEAVRSDRQRVTEEYVGFRVPKKNYVLLGVCFLLLHFRWCGCSYG